MEVVFECAERRVAGNTRVGSFSVLEKKKLNLNSPKGLHIKAQGCGTPLPWVNVRQSSYSTLKGLRKSALCNPFRVKAQIMVPVPRVAAYRNPGLCCEILSG